MPLRHCLAFVAATAANLQEPTRTQNEDTPQVAPSKDTAIPEIIVIGTLEQNGVPKVPLTYPASRDVLDPEAVRRTGARDLNDLVQYLPSVSTRPYNGGDASAPSFSMRGLPDDGLTEYTLVLIDGVPASPMPYGWTAFSFFPLITEQVHAIDLVRGGQAVRYSPNNVAGALNLITAPIPDGESYEARSTFGSYGYFSTLLSAGNNDGEFGYLVTLGERHGDGYRNNGDFEYSTADVKLRWADGKESWSALRLSYIENQHQAPGGLTLAAYDSNRFQNTRPDNQFRGFRGLTDFVHHVGDERTYLEYFASLAQTRRNLTRTDPVAGGPQTNFRVTDDDAYSLAAGVRGTEHFEALGLDHEIYWGLRASDELLPNRTTKTEPIGGGAKTTISDIEYELTALSAHVDDTFHPTEELQIVAGLRAEYVPSMSGDDHVTDESEDQSFSDLLPGLSASYELTDTVAAFANYQRSFRAPQVWGLDTTLADPSQSLNFEHGGSWEVGVRAQTEVGFSGSVAAWQIDFEDIAATNAAGVYENIGDIQSDGIDVVLDYDFAALNTALEGFSVQASMTWQDSEIVNAASPANDGNQTPYAWDQKAAWSLMYATESRWRVALGGVHVGESFSDDANTEPENAAGNLGLNKAHTVWDAQLSRELALGDKAVGRFSIGATNVFDEEWSVHSRGGFFGSGKVAGPPRQVYFGLQISL